METKTLIFCDGSSRGNPGPGGWGAIIVSPERVVEIGGGDRETTNNRMELTALIEGLRSVSSDDDAIVCADSQYVIRGATQWLPKWRANGWRTTAKQPVENQSLWEAIGQLMDEHRGKISFEHVRGHAGIFGNERADTIATGFADELPPELYDGPRDGYDTRISDRTQTHAHKKKSSGNKGKAFAYVSSVQGKVETHHTWEECERRVKGKSGTKFKKVFSPAERDALVAEWSA